MLDLTFITENADAVRENCRNRGVTIDLDELLKLADARRALIGAGVECERFDGMEQDADAIWTAPGGDRIAWFRDPDGHLLSISGR